ncbi:MAG: glutamate 5-kinase [Candidatus Eremiobacterota bacterium]
MRNFSRVGRIVVKLGTRVAVHPDGHANGELLMPLCRQISELRRSGRSVVVVSSGAVGLGRAALRPRGEESMAIKQALAALGQVELMNVYKRIFELLNVMVAQVLLTRDDLNSRERYLNARNTLNSLLQVGILPIINENDSVSVEEIRFGDNDILAALVGGLVDADLVVNLTQTPGLLGPDRQVVPLVERIDREQYEWVDSTLSAGGTGGMASKLEAARAAMGYGGRMIIASAAEPDILTRLLAGEPLGTLFAAEGRRLTGKKRWLAASRACRGTLRVDAGAARALTAHGKSLLAVGITAVEGDFKVGDLVAVYAPDGGEVGRGLCNLSAQDLRQACGRAPSPGAEGSKGRTSPEVIHRDNLLIHRHPRHREPSEC